MIGYLRFKLIDLLRGTSTLETLKFIETVERETPAEIDLRMNSSLKKYLEALHAESPKNSSPPSINSLPIINKAYANANRGSLLNKNYKGKIFHKKTGGSTGEPFVYTTGKESQSYLWATIILSWRVAGYKLGDPVTFLAGSSIFGTGWKQRAFYKIMNTTLLSAFDMTEEKTNEYIKAIKTSKSKILYGYAAAIHRLSQSILLHNDRHEFSLKGVVCTAETLTHEMRKDIEKAFGAHCFSQYGCNDAGISSYECEAKSGFHLITTRCYPEVQEDGRLVATDMSNTAFFLPRYDSGDMVEMSSTPCTCGRGFPLIKKVIGRSNDIIVDQKNKSVHSEFFSHLFREDPLIKQFQITFNDDRLTINIHTKENHLDWSRYMKKIQSELTFSHIEIIANQPFTLSKNGKVRNVMRIEQK